MSEHTGGGSRTTVMLGSLSPPLCGFGNPAQVARLVARVFSLFCHLAGSSFTTCVSVVCMYGHAQSDQIVRLSFYSINGDM